MDALLLFLVVFDLDVVSTQEGSTALRERVDIVKILEVSVWTLVHTNDHRLCGSCDVHEEHMSEK